MSRAPGARERALPLFALPAALALGAALFSGPLPQDPAYHDFADQRPLLGVPHALNVLSNMPFLVVGLFGLKGPCRRPSLPPWERAALFLFFAGVGLTALGSAYYHLAPDNARLLWDRLPMSLAFAAFFALVVGQQVGAMAGRYLLLPAIAAGIGSVLYWYLGELEGRGDLRFYALVQFYPLAVLPLLLWRFPSPHARPLLLALGLYAAAKGFEVLDAALYDLGRLVSGHTLKHLAAGAATAVLLRLFARRQPAIH